MLFDFCWQSTKGVLNPFRIWMVFDKFLIMLVFHLGVMEVKFSLVSYTFYLNLKFLSHLSKFLKGETIMSLQQRNKSIFFLMYPHFLSGCRYIAFLAV